MASSAAHCEPPSGRLWYVRRGETVRGPFPAAAVKRYLLLGRVRPDDEVSRDGTQWLRVAAEPMFAADEIGAPTQLPQGLDERKGGDRRDGETDEATAANRRTRRDRRRSESAADIERGQRRRRVLDSLRPARERPTVPLVVALIVTAAIIGLGIWLRPVDVVATSACHSGAAPGVNWNGCDLTGADLSGALLDAGLLRNAALAGADLSGARLKGADLSFADLSGAHLRDTDLGGAILRGALLSGADLAGASLTRADLSYADFRGANVEQAVLAQARLDAAMWTDGRVCAPGSQGVCR